MWQLVQWNGLFKAHTVDFWPWKGNLTKLCTNLVTIRTTSTTHIIIGGQLQAYWHVQNLSHEHTYTNTHTDASCLATARQRCDEERNWQNHNPDEAPQAQNLYTVEPISLKIETLRRTAPGGTVVRNRTRCTVSGRALKKPRQIDR